jgi:hypothetical protein
VITPADRLVIWVWNPKRADWMADRMCLANEAQARDRASDLRLEGFEVRLGDKLIGPPEGPPDP